MAWPEINCEHMLKFHLQWSLQLKRKHVSNRVSDKNYERLKQQGVDNWMFKPSQPGTTHPMAMFHLASGARNFVRHYLQLINMRHGGLFGWNLCFFFFLKGDFCLFSSLASWVLCLCVCFPGSCGSCVSCFLGFLVSCFFLVVVVLGFLSFLFLWLGKTAIGKKKWTLIMFYKKGTFQSYNL